MGVDCGNIYLLDPKGSSFCPDHTLFARAANKQCRCIRMDGSFFCADHRCRNNIGVANNRLVRCAEKIQLGLLGQWPGYVGCNDSLAYPMKRETDKRRCDQNVEMGTVCSAHICSFVYRVYRSRCVQIAERPGETCAQHRPRTT